MRQGLFTCDRCGERAEGFQFPHAWLEISHRSGVSPKDDRREYCTACSKLFYEFMKTPVPKPRDPSAPDRDHLRVELRRIFIRVLDQPVPGEKKLDALGEKILRLLKEEL